MVVTMKSPPTELFLDTGVLIIKLPDKAKQNNLPPKCEQPIDEGDTAHLQLAIVCVDKSPVSPNVKIFKMIGSPTNCLIIWIKYTCTQDLSPPITT
jgi:hypothetical protein